MTAGARSGEVGTGSPTRTCANEKATAISAAGLRGERFHSTGNGYSDGGHDLTRLVEILGGGPDADARRLTVVLLRLARRHWRHLAPALVAAALLSGLALAPPALLAQLIDKVLPSRAHGLALGIGAALLGIAVLDAALSFARRMLAAVVALDLRREILKPVFAGTLRLTADHAWDQGRLGRCFEEVERLTQGASESLLELALGAAMIVVLATTMLLVDARIGIVVLAVVAALAALHLLLARALRARESTWFDARSRLWSHLVECIAYAATIRFNSAHGFAERRLAERLDRDLAAHRDVIRLTAGLDAGGRLAGGCITAAIALIGGMRMIEGAMTVGDFVLLLSIGGSLAVPVLAMVKTLDDYQALTVALGRLTALAAGPHEAIASAIPAFPRGHGRLAITGLDFAYDADGRRILRNLSLTLEPGERVALTGPSGIGKSTLASLIFALRQPLAGAITLDGVPIADVPLGELRRRVALVPHEIDMFTGSIAENIALPLAAPDAAAVERAARLACLHDDIMRLPDGYDTRLGEGGLELSAGQKQRLGLARALLLAPEVLVLDESTSALDLATEARVLDNLLAYLPGTGMLAITHRVSVAERMDRSVCIAD
jgi:ATP-binding cassette, subfamily B, bacterial